MRPLLMGVPVSETEFLPVQKSVYVLTNGQSCHNLPLATYMPVSARRVMLVDDLAVYAWSCPLCDMPALCEHAG